MISKTLANLSRSTAELRLGHDVYRVDEAGMAFLADLERGRFFGLDEVGAAMLSAVLEVGEGDAVGQLAGQFGVEENVVEADLGLLIADLKHRGLVVDGGSRESSLLTLGGRLLGLMKVGSIGSGDLEITEQEVASLLRGAWLSLRVLGWSASLRAWRRQHRPLPRGRSIDLGLVASTVDRVDRLIRLEASRSLWPTLACKERALAAYQILRGRFDLPAELVIGIEPHPFRAHAWVESNGRIVTDDPARCEPFTPIARFT